MTVGTGKNIGTQTAKPTLAAIPPLTKCTEVKDDDIIDLNKQCFQYKLDGETIRDGNDIFGRHGSATKAKYRAVTAIVNSILNPKLTEE